MKRSILALACAGALSLGGCAQVISQLQQGTTALINFNNALISLNITIIGNLKAQAQQLAPLVCGAVSLGQTLAANPTLGAQINGYLAAHKGQNNVVVVASALCAQAGLSSTVTSVPSTAVVPTGTGG